MGEIAAARNMRRALVSLAHRVLPSPVLRSLYAAARRREYRPAVGHLDLGDLRRTTPVSRRWGRERGQAIDRYYIEQFLAGAAGDVRGRVLEIGDSRYTVQFGGARVKRSDVLEVQPGNLNATVTADLADAPHLSADSYDCAIVTQTLQYVFDVRSAVATLARITKPGGVVLVTVPGITPIADPRWNDSWCWSFTTQSIARLFAEHFDSADVTIVSYGNVLSAAAFLYGMAAQELSPHELTELDPSYQLVIAARAVKRS